MKHRYFYESTSDILENHIVQFQLLTEQGPMNQSVPIGRYLDAEKWGDAYPEKVEVFEQCCAEFDLLPEKLTTNAFSDWVKHYQVTLKKVEEVMNGKK